MHVPHSMEQVEHLSTHSLNQLRRVVSQPCHRKGTGKVKKLVAIRIPDVHPLCPLPEDWPVPGYTGDVVRLVTAQFAGQPKRRRPGDLGQNFGKHGIRTLA